MTVSPPLTSFRSPARRVIALLLGFVLLSSGCGQVPPLEQTIVANTPMRFSSWEMRFARAATPQEREQFAAAVQELRVKAMSRPGVTGSDAVSAALREWIHGLRVREVIQTGIELKLDRLQAEHGALQVVMQQNALLQTREGDRASEQYLVQVHRQQAERIEKLEAQIVATERELTPFREASGKSILPAKSEDRPAALPPGKWKA